MMCNVPFPYNSFEGLLPSDIPARYFSDINSRYLSDISARYIFFLYVCCYSDTPKDSVSSVCGFFVISITYVSVEPQARAALSCRGRSGGGTTPAILAIAVSEL